MRHVWRTGLVAAILPLAGCGLLPISNPEPTLDPDSVARFQFIRDGEGFFSDAERTRAEAQLRDIALRSGVLGVVLTAASEDVIDPARDYTPIIGEARAIGAEVLITLCTPDACTLDTAAAFSEGLSEGVGMVAPVPEPAPGQGLPGNPGFELHRWVEFVGAIATLPEATMEP